MSPGRSRTKLAAAKRRRPESLRYPLRCSACALPVHGAMIRCPWCTTALAGDHSACPRPRRSSTSECGECGEAVRPDWCACPWCGTTFRWSLLTATASTRAILEEAGASAIAKRVRVRYARGSNSFVVAGDDENVRLAAGQLRTDAKSLRWFERARRLIGGENYFAFDHGLHVPLHECGHVFEHYLRARRRLDVEGVASLFGDLDAEYDVGELDCLRARLRFQQSRFVSAYATVHPCEDFAETFAVAAFLRADVDAIRRWAKYRGKGPIVVQALEWIAAAIRGDGA